MNDLSVVVRASGISWCDLGQDVVILRIADNAYYRLGATARELWLRLDQPRRIDELIRDMCAACEGDPNQIGLETADFLRQCLTLGLVAVESADG